MKPKIFIIFLLFTTGIFAQKENLKIALLKYNGGGDWYANPTSLPNLIKFCNKNLNMQINPTPATVEAGSDELFNYPFLHMTGHGNVIFSAKELENLRNYMLGGGFLHIDDNYGMDEFARREIAKIFPDMKLIEIPFSHPIYHQTFEFSNGMPKVHEHDNKQPQSFGIFHEERLILLYTYETDLGDGWEDAEVHNDSEKIRTKALQAGANILEYCFTN